MEPTQELADSIYRERVHRARRTPPAQKFLAVFQLHERACCIAADGIRHQFPDADETRVQEILAERIALRERLETAR